MNKVFNFLEQHKFGILIAITVFVGMFIYTQMQHTNECTSFLYGMNEQIL
jgi:hypothetical protein